jgi:hypothetical protein
MLFMFPKMSTIQSSNTRDLQVSYKFTLVRTSSIKFLFRRKFLFELEWIIFKKMFSLLI